MKEDVKGAGKERGAAGYRLLVEEAADFGFGI